MVTKSQTPAVLVASLTTVEVCLERRTQLLCTLTLLVQSTSSLTSRGLTSVSTSTVGGLAVCTGKHTELLVVNDSRVVCVDEDHFEELVLSVLANPVRVEDFQVREVTCNTLFCDTLRVLGHGNLGDTGLGWLALHVNLTLTKSTTADTGTDEDNALLCFVAHSASGVKASWAFDATIDRLAAPLCHASLPVHVGQCILWTLPS